MVLILYHIFKSYISDILIGYRNYMTFLYSGSVIYYFPFLFPSVYTSRRGVFAIVTALKKTAAPALVLGVKQGLPRRPVSP